MNRFEVKKEVMEALVSKVSIMKSNSNHVAFSIGVKSAENGLGCDAVIVNGGAQADIRFAVSGKMPADGKPLTFNLSAADFCSYVGAMLAYNSDITMTVEDAQVVFSIGTSTRVPLRKSAAGDTLLSDGLNLDGAVAKVSADTAFADALAKGGFLVDGNEGFTSRAYLVFEEGRVSVYSTDNAAAAKSVASAVVTSRDTVAPEKVDISVISAFLRDTGAKLEKEEQNAFLSRVRDIKDDPEALLAYAKEFGFAPGGAVAEPVAIQLLGQTVSLISRLFAGLGKDYAMILTDKYLHIRNAFITGSFALAGTGKGICSTVDTWQNFSWVSKIVVDRDALIRNLNLLKLTGTEGSIAYSVTDDGLEIVKDGVVTHTPVSSSEGELTAFHGTLSVVKLLSVLNRLSAGNTVLRFFSEKTPLLITNGDLSEENISTYMYVIGVNTSGKEKGSSTEAGSGNDSADVAEVTEKAEKE